MVKTPLSCIIEQVPFPFHGGSEDSGHAHSLDEFAVEEASGNELPEISIGRQRGSAAGRITNISSLGRSGATPTTT
jgi:hypothetical protein